MTTKEQYILENARLKSRINQLEIELKRYTQQEKAKGIIRKSFGVFKKALAYLW